MLIQIQTHAVRISAALIATYSRERDEMIFYAFLLYDVVSICFGSVVKRRAAVSSLGEISLLNLTGAQSLDFLIVVLMVELNRAS